MTYQKLLRLAGFGIVLTIWVLSLIPVDNIHVPGGDKTHHFIAYFTCMFVWGQLYVAPSARLRLAIAFIVMGVLVECAQGLTSYRFFEWMDMVANAIGVVAAWLVVTLQHAVHRRFIAAGKS